MAKDTMKILEELQLCPDFRSFYDENRDYMVSQTLSQLLEQLLTEKGLKKSQVIKNAEISEVYGYQIFSGIRIPDRKKLLALAVGMTRLAMKKEKKRVAAELQLHSDQGFQYTSTAYFKLTQYYGITPSMSSKGNPYDNAMAENFFLS